MSASDEHAGSMHILGHLRELRITLLWCLVIALAGATISYSYASSVFHLLCAPFFGAFPSSPLIGTAPSEAWFLKLKISLFSGVVLTAPALFFMVWRFIAPGLYQHERRGALPFVLIGTVLFVGGASFCYWVVLPLAFAFFHDEFISIGVTPNIKVGEQVSMTLSTMAGFGAIFELPLVTYVLTRLGIVDHHTLIRGFKHAILCIFIAAAILTPPDVFSQFLMAIPLLILYTISIGVAFLTASRGSPTSPREIVERSGERAA